MEMTDLVQRLTDALVTANNFVKLADNNLKVPPESCGDYDAPLIAEARAALAAAEMESTIDGGIFHEIKKIYKAIIAVGSGK